LPCHIHTSDIIQNRDELAYGNLCKFFVIDSSGDELQMTAPAASANQPPAPARDRAQLFIYTQCRIA
jgi:hypothetical protein